MLLKELKDKATEEILDPLINASPTVIPETPFNDNSAKLAKPSKKKEFNNIPCPNIDATEAGPDSGVVEPVGNVDSYPSIIPG